MKIKLFAISVSFLFGSKDFLFVCLFLSFPVVLGIKLRASGQAGTSLLSYTPGPVKGLLL